MRRVIGPAVLATMLLLLSAQIVLGAKPFHERFTLDETIPGDELCGIEVTTHLVIKATLLGFDDHFVDISRAVVTWTNADGDWLRNSVAGPTFIQEQLDGDILTITERHVGVHSHLTSAAGKEPAFDRGTVTFVITIDLNDLENEDDDVFLGFEVVKLAGPHPEVDSDFELFCEVVTEVLG